MPKKPKPAAPFTLGDDVALLDDVLNHLVDKADEHHRETTQRYGYRSVNKGGHGYGYYPYETVRHPMKRDLADAVYTARWALDQIKKKLVTEAAQAQGVDLQSMIDAILRDARADAEAIRIDAEQERERRLRAANASIAKKREDWAQERNTIRQSLDRAIANANKEIDKRATAEVERRIDQMFGRTATMKRKRKMSMARGKKLKLVDA